MYCLLSLFSHDTNIDIPSTLHIHYLSFYSGFDRRCWAILSNILSSFVGASIPNDDNPLDNNNNDGKSEESSLSFDMFRSDLIKYLSRYPSTGSFANYIVESIEDTNRWYTKNTPFFQQFFSSSSSQHYTSQQ